MVLSHDVPVAFEEECCDDGDVEHTDAGGEEVCFGAEVVVADAAEGGKADEVEADFILLEHDCDTDQGNDV